MKLYGIRFAKGFKYGTRETVFRTEKGNRELIPDFPFFYYLAEYEGLHIMIDTGFRDERLAADMGVALLPIESEIRQVFGIFPKIDVIFLTHSHWDHTGNIDLYPEAKTQISLVEERECFYDFFHFEVIGGHAPDSSVLCFQADQDTYCITGDECYLCDNMERNIAIGICSCKEKNERFIRKAYERGWIPLPFHDAEILDKYDRLTENIVRIV